jgi:hypothetical protein
MEDTKTVIGQAYSAFNKRDIDGALTLMTQDVSWPRASEGGKITGQEEIRAYWTRQWDEFNPCVEPLAMSEEDGGKTRVRVRQLVKNLQGDVLSDSEVSTYSPWRTVASQPWTSGVRPTQALVRLPHSHIDPNEPRQS